MFGWFFKKKKENNIWKEKARKEKARLDEMHIIYKGRFNLIDTRKGVAIGEMYLILKQSISGKRDFLSDLLLSDIGLLKKWKECKISTEELAFALDLKEENFITLPSI